MGSRWLLAPFVSWLVLVGLVVVVEVLRPGHIGWLMREMAVTAHVHPLMGVVSNIGALAWAATAAICLFSGMLLRRRKSPASRFLLWTGAFTLWLLFDDFFTFHETMARRHLHLSEHSIYAAYGLLSAAYLFFCRRQILGSDCRLLLAAFAGFALSLGLDIVAPIPGDWNLLPEDGAKLLGIFCWFAYHTGVAYEELGRTMGAPK